MGLGKKLKDWNVASDAFEHERDADLSDGETTGVTPRGAGSARKPSEARIAAVILKVVALVGAALGLLSGIGLGRTVDEASRPLGLAAAGWVVILGALVSALILYALAAGLSCLDDIRRNTGRSAR